MENLYFDKRFELQPDFSGDYLLYICTENPSHLDTMLIISCGLTYPDAKHFDVRHSRAAYYSFLCSLIYITGGRGYIETVEGKLEFKKGDLVLFNVMTECVFYADKDDPYSALWVNYSGTLFYSLHHYYRLSSPIIITKADVQKNMSKIIETVTEFYELEKKDAYNIILHEFLDIFVQINDKKSSVTSKESELAEKLKSYIDQYPKYDLTLLHLSEKFHYSTRHISRVFEKYYAITPTQYIAKRKIEASKNLLHLNMSSTQISNYLGFCDVNHYIKVFKSIENITPAQYKKKINREINQ